MEVENGGMEVFVHAPHVLLYVHSQDEGEINVVGKSTRNLMLLFLCPMKINNHVVEEFNKLMKFLPGPVVLQPR